MRDKKGRYIKGHNQGYRSGGYRTCPICGKSFYFYPHSIKQKRGKFCSVKCQFISFRGESGIAEIRERIRQSFRYTNWRQQIFLRDNFTCQICGKKGGDLEAHHKKPFYKLLEEVKKYLPLLDLYEGAMVYSPLWDLDNGETQCIKCHNKTKGRR